jgi:hypothetical protein
MAIGEFGGVVRQPAVTGTNFSAPLYWMYEMAHAALNPDAVYREPLTVDDYLVIDPLQSAEGRAAMEKAAKREGGGAGRSRQAK